jgi:ADP-ribosylglycohydrolase/8-oxo-dGTP pyrophosphatase MutT (NUDIX family)
MWLMTRVGFFSIVQKPDHFHLTIRSRSRADLDRLRDHYLPTLADAVSHADSAYPWRATATHEAFAAALALVAKDIDYPAVQDELTHSLGAYRAGAYGKVWSMLAGTADEESTAPVAAPFDGLPWSASTPFGKPVAYGGVIIDARGNLLMREVKNHFDGYVWSFAKGRPDPGETPRQTALREVFEETGVVGRILTPIPGEFAGGTSVSRYFLMLAGPDVALDYADEETASLCWATPEQARELIVLSTNTTGRARDLALLDAALACLPQPLAQPIARREDWKTRPMPARRAAISIPANTGRSFSEAEMARLRCGLLPAEMEDKWFACFEDGVLNLHRSWTGNFIYRVAFVQSAAGWRVPALEVNLHPRQHKLTDAAGDAGVARMFALLDGILSAHEAVAANGDVDVQRGANAEDQAADEPAPAKVSAEAAAPVAASAIPLRQRFLGCLLGGAVGDALGAPVEFMKRVEILRSFGPDGITAYAPAYGGVGMITDDTQMTLFTAEGLLRGWVRGCFKGITTYPGVVAHAYLRWLQTQGERAMCDIAFGQDEAGWLFAQGALHARRAPGNTCLLSLRAMPTLGAPAQNDSKGCGGVMRMAPLGLFAQRVGQSAPLTFALGTELAALTHGHPTGSLTGGVLAVLILEVSNGASWSPALETAKACLRAAPAHQETLAAIEAAEYLSTSGRPHQEAIAELGLGWVAEEALSISIYCALVATDFNHGIVLAVNHDGDSDSTGAIVGNLLGAMHGLDAIAETWLAPLEMRGVIAELAGDLYDFPDWNVGEYATDQEMNQRIWAKYPGF